MEILDLIVLAAGKGRRVSEPVSKQFLDLNGKPVIIHALSKFENLPYVGKKYVTAHPDDVDLVDDMLSKHEITNFEIVRGGNTRQESVRLALDHVRTERVLTHNAALPFVTRRLIDNVVLENYPCVTTVTPMEYSLCRGDTFADEIVQLDGLKLINTPQSFHSKAFRECHRQAHQERVTVRTDCELMLRYGYSVKFVEGDPKNFKITTPLDMLLAKSLLQSENEPGD